MNKSSWNTVISPEAIAVTSLANGFGSFCLLRALRIPYNLQGITGYPIFSLNRSHRTRMREVQLYPH